MRGRVSDDASAQQIASLILTIPYSVFTKILMSTTLGGHTAIQT